MHRGNDNENSLNKDNIAVLVVSCDKYSDLWKPFFNLFSKFWPDCPFPVYLLSNELSSDIDGVTGVPIGPDVSWSDNLKNGLNKIKEEYVLIFIDDLFLVDRVETANVLSICKDFKRAAGNYLRFNPSVKADAAYNNSFGIVSTGTIYRASTVLSLWNKKVLNDLLKSGENAWEFEVSGTIRSDKYEGFYSTWNNCFPVVNGVIKGKWRRKAFSAVKSLYPDLNCNSREMMNSHEEFIYSMKIMRHNMLNMLPPRIRRNVKHIILAGKYNYSAKSNLKNSRNNVP